MRGASVVLRLAEAAYRVALRLYPRRFRERFGEDLLRAFRDGSRGVLRRGGWRGLAAFWSRCAMDALVEAGRVRWGGGRGAGLGRGVDGAPGPGRREPGGAGALDALVRDARDAWRAMLRRPGPAAVAVLTLALGVGANAAIFSVVNGVLLRPFDYPEAGELVVLQDRSLEGGAPFRTTGGAFLEWRAGNRTLDDVALMGGWTMNLTEPGLEPERVTGSNVSESFFSVLGVEPALGRTFRAEEMRGGARVVILSDALWRGRYGADPDIVGRALTVDGEAWRVVGVMPPVALPTPLGDVTVDPLDARRVWVPLDFDSEWVAGYRSHVFVAIGRLRDGVTPEAAASDIEAITGGIRERQPDGYARLTSDVRPLREVVLGDVRRDLWILLGAVALVLLVACANLTNLLLARSVERARERSVRAALGAAWGRLLRLGLLEAGILGIAGGALGLAAAALGMDVLVSLLPEDLPRRGDIHMDGAVLAFTAAASLVAALAAGLVPALRGARPATAPSLGSGARGSAGHRAGRLTRGLVASQLALACALLVGAGLLVRSFQALRATDLGADTAATLDAEILLPNARYGTREAAAE
ncbi:MAG: ABC transporter permease, partial [Gemmatimonadetes bacterium]|nr:ABC transporter permease [Gemmatimonadota bacterium]